MARPKAPDPMLVQLDPGIPKIKQAIEAGYDATIKEACRCLRTTRTWAEAHVRATVHHIYIAPKWTDWIDASWVGPSGGALYKRQELDAIVAAAEVTRRTRVIHPANHMTPGARRDLQQAWYEHAACPRDDYERQIVLWDRLVDAMWDMTGGLAGLRGLVEDHPEWHRGPWSWVDLGDEAPASLAELRSRWSAETPASMTDWGESSEEVQRRIWLDGLVRIAITMPDGAGRVLYGLDPTPERRPKDDPAVDTDGYRGVLAGISVTVPVEALPASYWDAYLPVG